MAATDETDASLQYQEMIMAAVEALKEKTGANKSAISSYIELEHGELPAEHDALLTRHLNQMTSSGELIMVKDSYMKPNPDAPPQKRGRGRPPKPKADPPPPGTVVVSPPRPRGRPPKPRDPFEAPPAKKPKSGRPRGRPPKKNKEEAPETGAAPPSGDRRPRGRPPKVKPAVAAAVGC